MKPRRHAICDAVRATGYAHKLGPDPYILLHGGRALRFCSAFPCLMAWLCDRRLEDREPSAIGHAYSVPTSGTA